MIARLLVCVVGLIAVFAWVGCAAGSPDSGTAATGQQMATTAPTGTLERDAPTTTLQTPTTPPAVIIWSFPKE